MTTALDQYKSLIRQAEELEKMASPNKTGGSTFWDDMRKQTAGAIGNPTYRPRVEDDITYVLESDALYAINQVATKHLSGIWSDAAVALRRNAAAIREALEKQAADVASAIADIDKSKP